MITFLNNYRHKKIFIIMYVNKWYNILLEGLIQQYLHMDRQEVGKHILCLEMYMQKMKKEKVLYHRLLKIYIQELIIFKEM